MNATNDEVVFAMCAVRILGMIGVVAVVAYLFASRLVFVAGTAGAFLGLVVPHGREYVSGSVEAIIYARFEWTAGQVLWIGSHGAVIGVLVAAAFSLWWKPTKSTSPTNGVPT